MSSKLFKTWIWPHSYPVKGFSTQISTLTQTQSPNYLPLNQTLVNKIKSYIFLLSNISDINKLKHPYLSNYIRTTY